MLNLAHLKAKPPLPSPEEADIIASHEMYEAITGMKLEELVKL